MSVVIRRIKTTLQREYRKAGGILIEDAIARADENLEGLAAECLERIDTCLELIADMTVDPGRRPSMTELRMIHALVNEMLACCATFQIDGLVETLYAVGRLVGALMATASWLEGALTPAVNLLRLVRRGAIAPQDLAALITGIDQCAAKISAHARQVERGPLP
ncbi:hypothetical protein BZG35_13620 [Brevundimonas sp. LM2]|uniref:hypothetical protein n=1 Tax=Brevundimonas sp. LM2 TaxID=1938605 RepID=UPI0009839DE5|nr:hypothetical protein [Brevundimonas sp. LM2]AQR62569.1 hypothetical protein BZG35_13620 [Brevundimonas sp. LM2]